MSKTDAILTVDVSDAMEKIDKLKWQMSDKQARQLHDRVIRATGRKVKGIVSTQVPKKYHIKKRVVAADIGRPKMNPGGATGNLSCSIPIEGVKHIIGGKTFPAKGGRHGWTGIKAGKRYKIRTQIVKGQTSVLPEEMKAQGGNPPFRNLSASRLNGATFTRELGVGFPPNNLPLSRVVGLAVPQMPVNRSEEDVQGEIGKYMLNQIDREFRRIMSGR